MRTLACGALVLCCDCDFVAKRALWGHQHTRPSQLKRLVTQTALSTTVQVHPATRRVVYCHTSGEIALTLVCARCGIQATHRACKGEINLAEVPDYFDDLAIEDAVLNEMGSMPCRRYRGTDEVTLTVEMTLFDQTCPLRSKEDVEFAVPVEICAQINVYNYAIESVEDIIKSSFAGVGDGPGVGIVLKRLPKPPSSKESTSRNRGAVGAMSPESAIIGVIGVARYTLDVCVY